MTGWLLCLLGRHDWDPYGQCQRNWMHVQTEPGDTWIGMAHLLRGTEYADGPYSRVSRRRYAAQEAAGRELQARLAAMGEDVSLELCEDAFTWPDHGESLITVVRDRQERRTHDRLAPR